MKFSEFISKARKDMGLTQEQLGYELNYSYGHINQFEKEKKFPRIDKAEVIAERLGYEIVYIKKGQGNDINNDRSDS